MDIQNLTEQQLLSKETFLELFKMSTADRIDEENKLFLKARELGVYKQFEKSLKSYKKSMKMDFFLC